MRWLAETHGVHFELVRHFLQRMFDGEWSSMPGQWRSAAISLVSLFLPAGLLLVREGSLGRAGARVPAIADDISLMTLLISVTGLIALLEWHSLFPSARDYLALASLPVRPRQIFTARFTAVMIFSAAIIVALNLLPSLIAPMEFRGEWGMDSWYWARAAAVAASSTLACVFVFFAILALQGVMLNVLPARLFVRFSADVQGLLAGLFLLSGLYGWSIRNWDAETLERLPAFGAWLPPVWFAGLDQILIGERDAFFESMARRAELAAGAAIATALIAYLVCYRRYRKLLLESPVSLAGPGIYRGSMIRLLAHSARREAVMDFMAKTLARSQAHRLLGLVYLGAAMAVMLNSSLINGAILTGSRGRAEGVRFLVLFWPLACSFVMLNGVRHVLSIPCELRANWIFQITESLGRAEWASAVERFIIAYAIAPVYLILFPVAGMALGWPMALRMTVLQLLISLAAFEILFHSWQKLPFTCSHIPGQKSLMTMVGGYLALLGIVVPILSVIVAVGSEAAFLFPFFLAYLGGIWIWLRRRRRDGWGETKLIYEDTPAVVADLGIREITFVAGEGSWGGSPEPRRTSTSGSPI